MHIQSSGRKKPESTSPGHHSRLTLVCTLNAAWLLPVPQIVSGHVVQAVCYTTGLSPSSRARSNTRYATGAGLGNSLVARRAFRCVRQSKALQARWPVFSKPLAIGCIPKISRKRKIYAKQLPSPGLAGFKSGELALEDILRCCQAVPVLAQPVTACPDLLLIASAVQCSLARLRAEAKVYQKALCIAARDQAENARKRYRNCFVASTSKDWLHTLGCGL